nr:CPCC family cysteine-rich protein [Trabulsiella guamensis]
MEKRYLCPCCGERTLDKKGHYQICCVCKWQDDPVQSSDPDYSEGANSMSLNEAKEIFKASGKDKNNM